MGIAERKSRFLIPLVDVNWDISIDKNKAKFKKNYTN